MGGVLVETLPPVIDGLKSLTGWFEELTPKGQKVTVMLGALAVAIPPVTAALGFMVTGMAALTSPVGLALAGVAGLTAGLALLWPEQDKVTQSADLVTAAIGDEMTQSQLLQQVLSGDISMSVSAANQKLAEARSRHENVKAIIAEQRALKLQSTDYEALLGQISDAEGALNALGFPARDVATPMNADAFEEAQQHLADLRVQQQEFLKAGAEYEDQLKRTEENIEALEAAISDAEGGMVSFGNGMQVPIETAERLKETISGGGSGGGGKGGGGLTGAVKELAVETEEYANSEGWNTLKSNVNALIFEGQSFQEAWQDVIGSALDRLFDLAFSPAWDQLWVNLERAMSGSGGGGGWLGSLFGGLFSGGGGGAGLGSILGLDTGGDVTVSGRGGVDRNLTVLRTSDSERVSVRRPGDSMPGGGNVYVTIQTPDVASFQKSRAQVARQMRGALSRSTRGG